MKRVLYVSYDGMTDPLGEGQVINYLLGLTKNGYAFDILSFEKTDKFEKQGPRIKKILEENSIGWYPKVFHTSPPILSKIYDKVVLGNTAIKLHKKNKYDLVHCRGYLGSEVGLMLKKKYSIPFIFDMRGFWADEKLDGGAWNKKYYFWRQVYSFYKRKEIAFIKNANHIISLTDTGKTEIKKWSFYDNEIPISIIPCCANAENFSLINAEKKAFARKLNGIEPERFVLTYLGSLGSWYMIEEMLLFFKTLLAKIPNALFFIITNSDHNIILEKIESYQINKNSIKIITVPFSDVPINMYASDCSISFIKPVYSKMSSSPVKVGEILSMGIPLIANAIGDNEKLLVENKFGVLVKDFSEKTFNKIVENIEENINIEPQKIREAALKIFSLEEGVKKYTAVYKSLLG